MNATVDGASFSIEEEIFPCKISRTETVSIAIPEAEQQVAILGEKVTVERLDGTATYSSPGRPIAVVSNVQVEYQPAPPPKAAPAKPGTAKPAPPKPAPAKR